MNPRPADRCNLPHALWRSVEAMGIPPAALLRQAQLPANLHITGQSVTTAQYFACLRAVEELCGVSAPGVRMIEQAATSVHPPSTLAAFYARDFREGLGRLARFKRLCSPKILGVAEAGGACTITIDWLYAREPEPAISMDITFATIIELGRRGTGRPIIPRRVELARGRSPDAGFYEEYFGGPVRYGAARNALILKLADLDRPFPGHNPELLAMLTPVLGTALRDLTAQSSIAEQVLVVLKRSLPSGRPDIADIARQLGMSERTLQRRITDEGTHFRDLLATARKDVACQLLSDPTVLIDEIAYLLGYQDAGSFHRAFREWEGLSPARWRERQIGEIRPRGQHGKTKSRSRVRT